MKKYGFRKVEAITNAQNPVHNKTAKN